MNDDEKIVQIIPAEGWHAKFVAKPPIFERVVCFALVESHQSGRTIQEVRPMCWGDDAVEFCEESDNFEAIVHESERGGKG